MTEQDPLFFLRFFRLARVFRAASFISIFVFAAHAAADDQAHGQAHSQAQGQAQTQVSVDDQLAEAERLVASVDYEGAASLLERISRRHGLSHEQMIRLMRNLGVAQAVMGRDAAAKDSFMKLLALEPDFKIDPNMSPRVQAPYFEARGFWTAQTFKPGMEVATSLHRTMDSSVRITLRDPTHLAAKVLVGYRWEGDATYSVTSGAPVSQTLTIPPPHQPATNRLELYARAMDAHDNVLFESGSPELPTSVALPPPVVWATETRPAEPEHSKSILASPVFWIVATVVVAGGATAAVLATREPNTLPATTQSLRPALACGGLPCQ